MSRKKTSTEYPVTIALQNKIFEYARRENIELSVALDHHGYTFDDLMYEVSHTKSWVGPKPKNLSHYKSDPTSYDHEITILLGVVKPICLYDSRGDSVIIVHITLGAKARAVQECPWLARNIWPHHRP